MRLARAKPDDIVRISDGSMPWYGVILSTERMVLTVQPLDVRLQSSLGPRKVVGKRDVTAWYQKH